eukprot:scaffold141510_cov112-Phaeocystis_antarctica.AAC.1
MGEFGNGTHSEGCPWRLAKCSAKLAQDSGYYYGSITGITMTASPSLMYAAGQPFLGSDWFLYRLNLKDGEQVDWQNEATGWLCGGEGHGHAPAGLG